MLESFRVGDGDQPVVLLHGFMGTGRNLSAMARRWAEADPSRWFLIPDLTGHGTSPALPEGADIFTLARDVVETARGAGIDGPLHIVGHSLGGRVGLAAALLGPGTVAAVDLLDIAPGPVDGAGTGSSSVLDRYRKAPATAADRMTMRQALLDMGLSTFLTDWLLMNLVHTPEGYRWRVDREALERLHRKVNAADLWPAVEGHAARIRCARGSESSYVSAEDIRRLTAAGYPVAVIQGSGHYVHVEKPKETVELLTGATPWR